MATQIPKLITNVEPYFRYEGEANATTQDQFQGFLKNEHSVLAVLTKGIWQPTTAYEIGDIIKSPNMPKGFHAIAQTKGNSGANEPTWGTGTTNVSDGTVSWKLSKGDITVNGVGADSNGNIQINNINHAEFANQATTAKKADRADASIKANQDSTGQIISSTYIKDISGVDGAIKVTKGNGISNTISIVSKYPSWYTDRGDGSDGDFIPNENTTISGIKNYKRVFIKGGVTVTVDPYCLIKCLDSFVNEGTITADNKGAEGGGGGYSGKDNVDGDDYRPIPGHDGCGGGVGGAGGGYSRYGSSTPVGGAGGIALTIGEKKINFDKNTIKSFLMQGNLYGFGAGGGGGKDKGGHNNHGGNGGNGGGGIFIVSNTVKNQGTITANGENGKSSSYGSGGGGGGGGAIVIIATIINNNGTVVANGGTGGPVGGGTHSGANGEAGNVIIKQLGVL